MMASVDKFKTVKRMKTEKNSATVFADIFKKKTFADKVRHGMTQRRKVKSGMRAFQF